MAMAWTATGAEEHHDHLPEEEEEEERSPDHDNVNPSNIVTMLSEISGKLDALQETLARQSSSTIRPSGGSSDAAGQRNFGAGVGRIFPYKSDDQIIQECMDALNSLEDLSPELYLKAFRAFMYKKAFRKMFILVPDERKRDLIKDY